MTHSRQIDLALWTGIICGSLLRFTPAILTGFPVNDGGMLVSMIRDLHANRFFLPVTTSYNFSNLPFAYPPFGMYVAAFVSSVFAISELELLRWLPPLLSSAVIPVFYWLAREIFSSKSKAVLASLIYALLPGASDWLVMGGGLSRSFGILFSLLAIGFVYRLLCGNRRKVSVGLAVLFSSFTVLSHPEVGLQTAAICFLFSIYHVRDRAGLRNALLVAVGTAVLTAVWWLTVLDYHGFSPFQSAIQTGIHETLLASLFHTFFSTQVGLPTVPVFALLGTVIVVRRGYFLLILWFFLPFFIDPRNAPAIAIYPLLMLVSEGLYFFNQEFVRGSSTTLQDNKMTRALFSALPRGLFSIMLVYLFLVSYRIPPRLASISLGAPDRETMRWVRENTPPAGRFLLLTNTGNISPMAASYQEWFPVLAERQSVNTLQGKEWVLGSEFFPYSQRLVELQACRDVDCLTIWLNKNNVQIDFILFHQQGASQVLLDSLEKDGRYNLVYDSENAKIFALLP